MSVVDDNEKAVDPPVESGVEEPTGTVPNAVSDFQKSAKNEKKLFREHLHLNSVSGSEFFGQLFQLFAALISGLTKGNFERFEFLKMAYGFGEAPDGSMYNERWEKQKKDPAFQAANKVFKEFDKIADQGKTIHNMPAGPEKDVKLKGLASFSGHIRPHLARLIGAIAAGESKDYNTVVHGAPKPNKLPTQMTLNEVMEWGRNHINDLKAREVPKSQRSSAIGRYQILAVSTLPGLVKEMGLTGEELFDEEMQDLMKVRLLERRGLNAFLAAAKPDVDQTSFTRALKNFGEGLSKEFASVINPKTGAGSHDGVGWNKAKIDIEPILRGFRP